MTTRLGLLTATLLAIAGTLSGQGRPRAASPSPAPPPRPALEPAALAALKARSIGPAVMGGRVSDIALDPRDPFTFYVALGTGGLMKTTDNGATFKAVFEKEAVASIGAVAVAPSDPSVVWVGTGEANDRNSSSWGNGVYRSKDGGATWSHLGLAGSRMIGRIVVHPKDPDAAWVAALGELWGPGPDRGLFRTADGGKTWKAVLTAPAPYGDRVGCGDVALDPGNPDVLFATLYARVRTPWSFTYGPTATDGKDLGGIFKSLDGGATWKKLEKGLPGATGNIGLSLFPKDPRIVYAVIQSDEGGQSGLREVRSRSGGVFRTEDGGESWSRTSPLNPRPFYFSRIAVDPEEADRLYVLGFSLHVSEDGGRSFREDHFAKVHPDCHAIAIDPRHPRRVLLGTDGGVYQTYSGGAEGWAFLDRIAAGEYYRIGIDMSTPYRICGGLQDNRNWVGPSRTRAKDGITNADWINLGGGDGFHCVFDPDDRDVVYSESQQGAAFRFDLGSGQSKPIRPEPAEGQPALRFHWNAPLIGSRHDKGVLYLAGNRVLRLTERGERWRPISPDLSSRDPQKTMAVGSGAENYAVVYTLAESPLAPGLLWAGTDDGRVWITEDDGGSWTDLTSGLPAVARGQWMSRIEASARDRKVAYLAVSAFRSGNYAPLLYRTADGGRTWQAIASNLPPDGPAKVVREDPRNPDLLYAGTEFGLFVSLDRGARWTKLGGLPTVAVDDIVVHPREMDLVVATHGRSLFLIDDVRALQEATPEVLAREAYLFAPRPALAFHLLPGSADGGGAAVFRGANPPEGALLTYYVRESSGEPVKLEIKNAAGQPVANLTGPGLPGFNRLNWNLKPTPDLLVEYGGEGALFVPAGEYTVTLAHGKTKHEQKLHVDIAPGVETR